MRSVFLVAVISALAWARPETYKETEDFQFSRSSSDEGSKSGFYGAQRGNMGGNYEKAHNMDSLAQQQMSGAVRQVQEELGDASKTRTGSVSTAANSRGVYGSGQYDLSNLQGRNFAEGASSDNSQSSSFSSGYSVQSSGFHSPSGFHSHSVYQGGNAYDQLSSNSHTGDDPLSKYIVTLVAGPGTQVAIPVPFSQNAVNSEAEVLNNNQHHFSAVPQGNAKHYESSYGYRKAWERHSESNTTNVPIAVPTVNPYPTNSELNEDTRSSGLDSQQNSHSANGYHNYNSYAQSSSSQSRHHSEHSAHHNTQMRSSSNVYTHGNQAKQALLGLLNKE